MIAALIVEFDTLFLGGFALASETLNERLEKYGIPDNDPYRYVRQFYGKNFSAALTKLLPSSVDEAHVERRLAATYTALLQQNAIDARDSIKAILRPILTANIELALITRLRQGVIDELFAPITKKPVFAVADPAPLSLGVNPSIWQQALVTLSRPSRECRAFVSCGESVRTAMRIGLRSIAVPDPMVAFDDFGGADLVSDQMNKTFLTKLKARLA